MSEVPYIRMRDTSAYSLSLPLSPNEGCGFSWSVMTPRSLSLSLSLLEDKEMVALEDSMNPPVVALSGDLDHT